MNDAKIAEQSRIRFDRIDVADLILRERLARDNHEWEEMASLYHPDSVVDISWFKGTGAEFAKRTATSMGNMMNFHIMTPPVVDVRGDRAIAETPCIIRAFTKVDGTDASIEAFANLFWRAVREGHRWLIAGLRCAYKIDMMQTRDPSQTLHLKDAKLYEYRDSYRYLMFNLVNSGLPGRDDLSGFDRPETVTAVRTAQRDWLAGK